MEKKAQLTDVLLKGLKPKERAYEVSDPACQGLRAKVSATGKVTFILKVRALTGKLVTVKLGEYPAMSLKEGRAKALEARLAIKNGQDLNAEKQALRVAAATAQITLGELVAEYEAKFGPERKTWAPRGPKSERSIARQVIERVFAPLLNESVEGITEVMLANCLSNYRRVNPKEGDAKTANGQASRSRSYLISVLDWAAGRGRFSKIGRSRFPKLSAPDVRIVHDPASEDARITGKRKRVLLEHELKSVLPLLVYPAPRLGQLRLAPERDFRPVAMRFILFTAARLSEVCSARWKDIDRTNRVWHKPKVKTTRGQQRSQDLPLSDQAFELLMSLPGAHVNNPDALVFPNETGEGEMGNWGRIQSAIFEASGTNGWHRHDLRRTAASMMTALKVAPSTVEQILAHEAPHRVEGAGAAASHYLHFTRIMTNVRDPQEEALSKLAEVLLVIEGQLEAH